MGFVLFSAKDLVHPAKDWYQNHANPNEVKGFKKIAFIECVSTLAKNYIKLFGAIHSLGRWYIVLCLI